MSCEPPCNPLTELKTDVKNHYEQYGIDRIADLKWQEEVTKTLEAQKIFYAKMSVPYKIIAVAFILFFTGLFAALTVKWVDWLWKHF